MIDVYLSPKSAFELQQALSDQGSTDHLKAIRLRFGDSSEDYPCAVIEIMQIMENVTVVNEEGS